MKSLALYVDKWYIVGAHCGDGIPQPLRVPNGDDRIWLYFYNDRGNNKVSYSLKYREEAFAGEIDYYKDIFKLIPTVVGATFKRFGRNVEIRNIFSSAGIFEDLRSNCQKDEKIRTFISFSPDISLLAQSVFLALLNEHGFDVVEYVAHIGHLTLEYAYRHKLIEQSNFILVANACNENLRFALYQQVDKMFVCRKECLYEGLGIDLRKRAVLEQVVEDLEAASRFINNDSERKEEYNYLQRYVEDWIKLLDSDETSLYKPIPLGNYHLKKQPGNNYPISVMRSEIESRTSIVINDIVGAMLRMLSESGVQSLSHIVFLGNAFENSIFEKRLAQQIGLDSSHIIHFREERLSEIVSVYAEIDCTQFKEAENRHKKLSKAEKEQAEQAKLEREALDEARKKEEEAKAIRDKEQRIQQNLDEAIEYAQSAEREEKFEEALGFYKDALVLAPHNQQIENKIEELGNKIADIRSKKKQYDEYIEKAKQCIDDKKWDDAVIQSQMALEVKPKSEEAMRILNHAKDMSKRYNRLKECLSQTDFFISQGAFEKALEELRHAELLELNDASIEERIIEISKQQKIQKDRIDSEIVKLNHSLNSKDYVMAIATCDILASIDTSNQNNWIKRRAEIIAIQKEEQEKEKQWSQLIKDIDAAQWEGNWEEMVTICNKALAIKEDEKIEELLKKALGKINERKEKVSKQIETIFTELQEREREFDYKAAIELCHQLINMDGEESEKWKDWLQRLQALQIEKSDLEINFRRKKADLNVIIRSGDRKEAERQILSMRKKYWEYGITAHDSEFQKLLDSLQFDKAKKIQEIISYGEIGNEIDKNENKGKVDKRKPEKISTKGKPRDVKSPKLITSVPDSEGYRLLRERQYVKAKRLFATIEKNSDMASICSELIGLEKSKSNGTITKQEKARINELYKEYNIK